MKHSFDILRWPIVLHQPLRMTTVDGWHLHVPFAFFLVALQRPRRLVELGTLRGDSYCGFCQAVDELGIDTSCTAVDHWRGDDHAGFYGEEIYEELCRYHDPLYGRFSKLLRSSFDDAAKEFQDGAIDLLHIDGHHAYASVRHDFETWLPKMSRRGIVLFHDTRVRERNFGVWKLWEELRGSFPSIEFSFGHGLGVLAVGAETDADVLSFFHCFDDSRGALESLFLRLGVAAALSARQPRLESDLQQAHAAAQETAERLALAEGDIGQKAAEIRRLSDELGRQTAAAEASNTRAGELQQTIGDLERKIEALTAACRAAESANAALSQRVEEQEQSIRDYSQTVAALRRSLSWRATAPFRAVASFCLRLAPPKKR